MTSSGSSLRRLLLVAALLPACARAPAGPPPPASPPAPEPAVSGGSCSATAACNGGRFVRCAGERCMAVDDVGCVATTAGEPQKKCCDDTQDCELALPASPLASSPPPAD